MKKGRRLVSVILALALSVAALEWQAGWESAAAVTQAEIDALKNSIAGMSGEISALEEQLAQVQDDKEQALAQKENLDRQIDLLNRQIDRQDEILAQYDGLLADYDLRIEAKQAEVEELQAREEAQYALFCRRVRSMEEQGTVSYLSILFRVGSFAQLLDSAMLVEEIMEYDNSVIGLLQETRVRVEEAKAELEQQRAEQQSVRDGQQAVRDEQEGTRAQLQSRREQAEELVRQIMERESEYRTALRQMEEEEERVQAEIVRLSEELKAQTSAGPGGYIWPVSSRRVTSPFGSRNTGIAGASTNHKGVDIGGVYYTSEVRAAKAGTVIISARSSSYGNYVVVSHGNGNTTLYAHMSSRRVSVGDVVAQGDVLGITGDTGISRGPHLHFEITEGGVRVDPLQYLTGYIKAW